MLPNIRNYLILALTAALVVATLSAWQHRRMFKATDFALKTQNAAIERQNDEAEQKLKKLTIERDELRNIYDVLAKQLTANETKFNEELQKLRGTPPVVGPARVRIVAGTCGPSGDGGASGKARGPKVSGGTQATATGLLAPETVGRVDSVAFQIEELQRDFNLCQTNLLGIK